jgi:hypothetical protein
MLAASTSQFIVGSVLEREQGIVGTGHGLQDLVQLALRRLLMPGLGVLDHEDHDQGQRSQQRLEDDLPPLGEPDSNAHADPDAGRADNQLLPESPSSS